MTFAGYQVEDIKEPKHAPAAHLMGKEKILMYSVDPAI